MENSGFAFMETKANANHCHRIDDVDSFDCYRPNWMLVLPVAIQDLLLDRLS
jgi:hypothetical protein